MHRKFNKIDNAKEKISNYLGLDAYRESDTFWGSVFGFIFAMLINSITVYLILNYLISVSFIKSFPISFLLTILISKIHIRLSEIEFIKKDLNNCYTIHLKIKIKEKEIRKYLKDNNFLLKSKENIFKDQSFLIFKCTGNNPQRIFDVEKESYLVPGEKDFYKGKSILREICLCKNPKVPADIDDLKARNSTVDNTSTSSFLSEILNDSDRIFLEFSVEGIKIGYNTLSRVPYYELIEINKLKKSGFYESADVKKELEKIAEQEKIQCQIFSWKEIGESEEFKDEKSFHYILDTKFCSYCYKFF